MRTALRNLQAGTESLSFMIIKKCNFFRCKFKFKFCSCFQTCFWQTFFKDIWGTVYVPLIYSFRVGFWTAPKQNKEYFYNLLPTHFLFSPNHTHTVAQKLIKQLSQLFSLKWEIKSVGTWHWEWNVERKTFLHPPTVWTEGGGLQIREMHRIKETDRGPLASHVQRARTTKQLKASGKWIESEKTDVNHYSFQITHKRQRWELESPSWGWLPTGSV